MADDGSKASVDRAAVEAWEAELKKKRVRGLSVEIDTNDPLSVSVTESNAGRSVTLPLARLPDGCVIRFKRSYRLQTLRLEDCRPALTVELSGDHSYGKVELDGELGTLGLRCPVNQPIQGRAARVVLCGGAAHAVADVASARGELVLDGATVEGDLDGTLTVTARGGKITRGSIEELRFDETSPVADADETGQTFRLTLGTGVSFGRLVVPVGAMCELLEQPAKVSVLGGYVQTNQKLTIERVDGTATVTGTGTVAVPAGAVLGDLTLKGPALEAGLGATVLGMAGALKVAKAADATIVARPGRTYQFKGVIGNNTEPLKGATLRGITIKDTARGRRYLRQLSDAAVVDPNLTDLSIRRYGFRWQDPRGRKGYQRPWIRTRVTDENRREAQDAAYFAQELAGLVDAKSGEGSTRTAAAWAAYRGRHLVATTRTERWALALYRLVGYGQRPGPALMTWLVAVLAGAAAFMALSDPASGYGEALWRLAFAPFTLLRLVGDPALRDVNRLSEAVATLVQTIATVPVVFAGLAAARYLRADWPFKS